MRDVTDFQTKSKATDFSTDEWKDYRYSCPLEATLDVISGRWKGVILYHLLKGTKRFGEMRRLLPAVTQHSLTLQLRELERAGVVERTVYEQKPPKVEYSLTERGRALEPAIIMLEQWGKEYLGEQ